MNLTYVNEKVGYNIKDVSPILKDWVDGIRPALYEALDNGVEYFNYSSIEKVKGFITKVGGYENFIKEVKKSISSENMKVDAIHQKDQKELFGQNIAPWKNFAPLCYIFHAYSDGMVYFKVRITRKNKLGVDIHYAKYIPPVMSVK